jgi:hypothetical protein
MARQRQRLKSSLVGALKAQLAELDQIDALGGCCHACGPGQTDRDRGPHVRARHLCQHRPVAKGHEGVHDRLRMDDHLELRRRDGK